MLSESLLKLMDDIKRNGVSVKRVNKMMTLCFSKMGHKCLVEAGVSESDLRYILPSLSDAAMIYIINGNPSVMDGVVDDYVWSRFVTAVKTCDSYKTGPTILSRAMRNNDIAVVKKLIHLFDPYKTAVRDDGCYVSDDMLKMLVEEGVCITGYFKSPTKNPFHLFESIYKDDTILIERIMSSLGGSRRIQYALWRMIFGAVEHGSYKCIDIFIKYIHNANRESTYILMAELLMYYRHLSARAIYSLINYGGESDELRRHKEYGVYYNIREKKRPIFRGLEDAVIIAH
jgi:hypothetical protein